MAIWEVLLLCLSMPVGALVLAHLQERRGACRYAAEPCAPACEPLATPQADR